MLNFHAIKCNSGYYLTTNVKYESYYSINLRGYILDCGEPKPSFHKDWVFVERLPTKIQKEIYGQIINKRFELKDDKFLVLDIPKSIPFDEAGYEDSDGDFCWNKKYQPYESMYNQTWDVSENTYEDVPFQIELILEVKADFIQGPEKFNFSLGKNQHNYENFITNDNISHQLLDKIVFPSILLHNTPSSFTSRQVYDILRAYIKEHINPKYAKITSDYDFCFEVQKNLFLNDPESRETEVLTPKGKSYRPKQMKKIFINTRAVKVFEMTHKEQNYRGYTPIDGLIGDSEDDLAYKMQNLCEEITAMINEPLIECPHCSGRGVLLKNEKPS